MLRHPMGEARGAWASEVLGWAGDSPHHGDGSRQEPRCNCSSPPRDESPYWGFSHLLTTFHAVWSRIKAAFYQGSSRGWGGRACWWDKDHPGLNGDVWVWDHPEKQPNGRCTKGVLIAPGLAGHQDPNPPTCSFSGQAKVSLHQRPACSH